ncbi:pimeloyl-ACP methyl esterase BioG family protein [Helicobacter canadensis]|uniref:DUF452 family protein n=1 Tax=Helicobacter canadensis MIT 98-5491 TaxID=537970 RepID=C5ZYN0_9HELI|nr:pimeloyl-ACP methyl esterase BioG family protein [Helicobacter canadensis]EES90248.1 conserved hypothetical protein [Helicobacter canadensis MIT 98-5491]STO99973.1 Uncharacterized protein conserved in bacteria [Helicobacter canadensis]
MNIYHKINNNKNILLLFGGFASHFSHFQNFIPSNYDWILLSHYQHLDFSTLENLLLPLQNKNLHLLGFSMGVWVAHLFLNQTSIASKFKSKTAVNGTEYGIHETYGINPKLFALTQKKFNLESFKQNLFGNHYPPPKNFLFLEESLLKDELKFFLDHQHHMDNSSKWDRIIISSNDLVFPTQTQKNFWDCQGYKQQILEIDAPHFAFFDWKF